MRKLIGLFGVLALMAFAPLAHADYVITYNVGTGAPSPASGTPCLDNSNSKNNTGTTTCSATALAGNLSIDSAGGTSNSPGTAAGADEFSSVATLENDTSSPVTVTLWYLAQGFTMPVTGGGVSGIAYFSNASATGELGSGTSSLALESCVDQGTGGTGTSFCGVPYASLTNSLAIPATGTVSDPSTEVFSPLSATYSLEQQVTVVLGAGDTVNIALSQSLTPIPEPASIALLSGLILLTSGAIRRKRNPAARG